MPNLVGTGLNQVPTNGMLGGLAYQSPDHASIKDLDLKNLSQINSEIADTAVDIFIYDTSKDSDGGAWRHRTSHTSWYNETLNTATRGSRREFPAVVVLVLEGTKLTIYDGDDPDLPMWMVFNKASNGYFSVTTNSCVSALNGKIVSGGNASNDRLRVIDFLLDNEREYSHTAGQRTHLSPISGRNGAAGFTPYDSSLTGVIDRYINDVAMTVLPNAPIDDATGLPIPTIAVATDGGVSVIRDDGSVYDFTNATVPNTNYVNFFRDKISFGADAGPAVKWIQFLDIPTADVVYSFNSSTINWYNNYYGIGSSSDTIVSTPAFTVNANLDAHLVDSKNDLAYFGSAYGLGLRATLEENTPRMLAYATSSWASGYICGKIKGAFLSDTDATNVTGTELLTNGEFTSNVSGWSDGSGSGSSFSWSSDGGGSILFDGGAAYANAYQAITTVVGNDYTVISEEWVSGGGGSTSVYIGAGNTPPSGGTSNFYASASTVNQSMPIQFTFTATSTTTYITIGSGWSNVRIGRISMRAGVYDRSVNNKGLQVFGTINKTAVATGAELVGYSGFSDSNYLEQPYNSGLNFGTGDFSITVWVKPGITGSQQTIASFLSTDSDGNAEDGFYLVHYNNATGNWYIGTFENGAVQYTSLSLGSLTSTDKWYCLHVNKIGTTAYLYQDGEQIGSGTVKSDITINSADIPRTSLRIGRGRGTGTPNGGSIALLRISDSTPSAEQIKKIYEDEKVLFQENAACTLYGSSDAVTALAYDEVTERLHVGTSSGRSEFQGLRRINNTTTAVTTAISAYDSFVVEQ
jgi:hypothetical protein